MCVSYMFLYIVSHHIFSKRSKKVMDVLLILHVKPRPISLAFKDDIKVLKIHLRLRPKEKNVIDVTPPE